MRKALYGMVATVLACAACYLALKHLAGSGAGLPDVVLGVSAAVLVLAAIAAAVAVFAVMRAGLVRREFDQLTRSVDAALRDFSARSHRESATLEELNAFVSREMDLFYNRQPGRPKPASMPIKPDQGASAAAIAPPRKGRAEPDLGAVRETGADTALEKAVEAAVTAGTSEISLQPVVSISNGAAAGFDVYGHIKTQTGSVDLQRLPGSISAVSAAVFERWLITGAVDAAQRQFGGKTESLPLYVGISDALLSDDVELDAAVDLLRFAPSAAGAIVLALSPALIERPQRRAEGLERLAATGVRFAVEGWSGAKDALDNYKKSGIQAVRLSADRLLGRVKMPKGAGTPVRLIEAAAAIDLPVIAVGVASDEDAVTLIDLGVVLMTGDRFSAPRRLKPARAAGPQKVASA